MLAFGPRKQQMSQKAREIYTEERDPEFVAKTPEFERRFGADPRLATVIRELEQRDVRKGDGVALGSGPPVRPFFYYRERFRDLKLRMSPLHHPDFEASTIREWRC